MINIQDMQQLAEKRDGKCLSADYENTSTRLKWQCKNNHIWEAVPYAIRRGQWCPYCAGQIKHTIEDMQKIASSHSGECLSVAYANNKSKLRWQCKEGHVWWAAPSAVLKGCWCSLCSYQKIATSMRKFSIEDARLIASQRGGVCLSNEYLNDRQPLKWRCAKGHEWETAFGHIRNHDTWCPICSRLKYSIADIKEIAKERGGECLSAEYLGQKNKLTWKCKEGHTWEASTNGIVYKGYWCPMCGIEKRSESKRKYTLGYMQQIAKKREGKCLSTQFKNLSDKLKWQCNEGHVWESSGASIILVGTWCPKCAGVQQLTIEKMRQVARERGGNCLSKNYVNITIPLEWQCSEGHIWFASANNVRNNGSWCPTCSIGISERICKAYFELIFSKSFPKVRPRWLKNHKGNLMELDGYCKELQIAFEYQGLQHYERHELFHKDQNFLEAKNNDERKEKLCRLHNVVLITVPYTIEYDKMYNYIISECKKNGINIPEHAKKAWTELNAYINSKISELCNIAEVKGGECLSKNYVNSDSRLIWQCKDGHIWEAKAGLIKKGHWCPKCAGVQRLTLEDITCIAEKKGGNCLSKNYVNSATKLEWQCEEGHVWSATPNSIRQGQWCPYCAGQIKHTIEDMQKIASSHSGECLSVAYANNKSKLRWQCKEGHVWWATPDSILRGGWCRLCNYQKISTSMRKFNIEDAKLIAAKHGGVCLSDQYVYDKHPLKWRCAKGHIWERTFRSVNNSSSWCPVCDRFKK